MYAEHVLRINCTVMTLALTPEMQINSWKKTFNKTTEACIENLQNSHTDRTMVTDKSPRTRERSPK